MKYSELEKPLRKSGAYQINAKRKKHRQPHWYCPKTDRIVATSHHGNEEVKQGTLHKILKEAGLK